MNQNRRHATKKFIEIRLMVRETNTSSSSGETAMVARSGGTGTLPVELGNCMGIPLGASASTHTRTCRYTCTPKQDAGSATGMESGHLYRHLYSGYLQAQVCTPERERAPRCQQCDVNNSAPLFSSLHRIMRERERACMAALSSSWWWWWWWW